VSWDAICCHLSTPRSSAIYYDRDFVVEETGMDFSRFYGRYRLCVMDFEPVTWQNYHRLLPSDLAPLVRKAEDENFPPLEKEAEDNREASSALQSPAAAPSSVLGADVRTSHCQNKSDPPAVGPTGGPKDLTQVEGWGNKNLQLHVKNGNEEGKQSGTKKLKKEAPAKRTKTAKPATGKNQEKEEGGACKEEEEATTPNSSSGGLEDRLGKGGETEQAAAKSRAKPVARKTAAKAGAGTKRDKAESSDQATRVKKAKRRV